MNLERLLLYNDDDSNNNVQNINKYLHPTFKCICITLHSVIISVDKRLLVITLGFNGGKTQKHIT